MRWPRMNGRRWLIWAFLLPSLLPGLMSAFNAKADEFGFEMVEPEPGETCLDPAH